MTLFNVHRILPLLIRQHLSPFLRTRIRFCYASRHCSNFDRSPSGNSPLLTSSLVVPVSAPFVPAVAVLEDSKSVIRPAVGCGQSRRGVVKWMGVWAALSKARLTGLVVSTALAGCVLAAPSPLVCEAFLSHPAASLLALCVGTTLTSASANCINQIMEVQYDSMMKRTQMRPLVRNAISPVGASVFAGLTAAVGLGLLYTGTNELVASLAAGNILLYTCLYTPLKRVSQTNTWVGSVVGAIPPLMGWATATGSLQPGSLVLAGLLYTWQFPHFMSLSWLSRQEYAHAGYAMTVNMAPQRARATSLRHSLLASLICFVGNGADGLCRVNWYGGLAAAPFNAALVYYAYLFYRAPLDNEAAVRGAARRLFRAALIHLPGVMSALLICSHLGVGTTGL